MRGIRVWARLLGLRLAVLEGPLAEHMHAALDRSPNGLTRTQIRDLCQRNQ